MPIFELNDQIFFPNPSFAEPDGLLAVGGDLSVDRLIQAYANGIFPWFSDDEPILWWSPDPRCVLFPLKFKLSKSLKSVVKKNIFKILFDTDFRSVITHCANIQRTDNAGTWITNEIIEAYCELHEQGFAHSVEVYKDGKLVGGLYGVSLGRSFFGESMFHTESNASKVAMYYLVEKLKEWNFDIIDNQMTTGHLMSLGAEEIDRELFLKIIGESIKKEGLYCKWTEV